jgi:hypothetical protein
MQTLLSLLRADAVLGLGAAGLNLVVASVLVMLSLVLCVVVSLLAGLPVLAGRAYRTIRRLRRES